MSTPSQRKVSYDCRHYLGDRPCSWHKSTGVVCECEYYEPVKGQLLIIKLDAMGDVLRTASLLPVIAEAWPDIAITWITRAESVPLLEGNPYIAEVLPYGADALVHLASRSFDHVINLDASKISAGMAAAAKAKEKTGYLLQAEGYVKSTNAAAEEWLKMGVFDDLKRANKRSYQEIMCSILGLQSTGLKYVMELTDAEVAAGRSSLEAIGLDLDRPVIGIHTGGGGRWTLKQWSEERFIALITELTGEQANAQILLFGGALEREQNARIISAVDTPPFDSGCDNPVRHFASLVKCCSVLLSGDSLAMHVALAMESRTVVLFGPTSNTEIELFGLGEKVIPDMDCLSCYKKTCDLSPNCMDSISVKMVKESVIRQMARAQRP